MHETYSINMVAKKERWTPGTRPESPLMILVSSRDITKKAFRNLHSIRVLSGQVSTEILWWQAAYLTIDLYCYNSCTECSRQLPRPMYIQPKAPETHHRSLPIEIRYWSPGSYRKALQKRRIGPRSFQCGLPLRILK